MARILVFSPITGEILFFTSPYHNRTGVIIDQRSPGHWLTVTEWEIVVGSSQSAPVSPSVSHCLSVCDGVSVAVLWETVGKTLTPHTANMSL